MKYYFLSTGRSGSTFIYKLFNDFYPDINLTHQQFGSRLIKIISNIPLPTELSGSILKLLFQILKKDKIPPSTIDPLQSHAILKIINHSNLDNNQVKIVHLVRDPRSFITSYMNWKNSSVKRLFLHHFVPFWQPNPINDEINNKLKNHKKFKQFCKIWSYKNKQFYDKYNNHINYKLLRIEDLTTSINRTESFNDLIDFIVLPKNKFDYDLYSKTKINKSSNNKFPEYEFWTDDMKSYLNEVCGDLLKIFGYK